MTTYRILATAARRSYSLTVGLRVGYRFDAPEHTLGALRDECLRWMKHRSATGQPCLSGTVQSADVLYGWQIEPGRGSSSLEPAGVFRGEVSPLIDLTDEQVKDALCELGAVLGNALGQRRVYATYLDQVWILEAT